MCKYGAARARKYVAGRESAAQVGSRTPRTAAHREQQPCTAVTDVHASWRISGSKVARTRAHAACACQRLRRSAIDSSPASGRPASGQSFHPLVFGRVRCCVSPLVLGSRRLPLAAVPRSSVRCSGAMPACVASSAQRRIGQRPGDRYVRSCPSVGAKSAGRMCTHARACVGSIPHSSGRSGS